MADGIKFLLGRMDNDTLKPVILKFVANNPHIFGHAVDVMIAHSDSTDEELDAMKEFSAMAYRLSALWDKHSR